MLNIPNYTSTAQSLTWIYYLRQMAYVYNILRPHATILAKPTPTTSEERAYLLSFLRFAAWRMMWFSGVVQADGDLGFQVPSPPQQGSNWAMLLGVTIALVVVVAVAVAIIVARNRRRRAAITPGASPPTFDKIELWTYL